MMIQIFTFEKKSSQYQTAAGKISSVRFIIILQHFTFRVTGGQHDFKVSVKQHNGLDQTDLEKKRHCGNTVRCSENIHYLNIIIVYVNAVEQTFLFKIVRSLHI